MRVTRKATRVPYGEGLRAGERVPVWKLYYGLLLASANDTAVALAEAAGGTRERFLQAHEREGSALGLRHTHYRSASGLIDEGNYSTVRDLAMLTRHALRVPRFREIVATKHKRVRWRPPTHAKLYENHNKLLWRYAGRGRCEDGVDARCRAVPRCLGDATRHPADHRRRSIHPTTTATRSACSTTGSATAARRVYELVAMPPESRWTPRCDDLQSPMHSQYASSLRPCVAVASAPQRRAPFRQPS